MSALATVDQWLIGHLYQPIVDWTQRQPAWLARQAITACALLVACGTTAFMHDGSGWAVALFVALCLVYAVITLSPAFFAALGSGPFAFSSRITALVIVGYHSAWLAVATMARIEGDAAFVWMLLWWKWGWAIAMGSYFYFAACEPPRPKVPRTKLAKTGGVA